MLHDIRLAVEPSSPSEGNDRAGRQLREAEFAVASAISVREQQKARLISMVPVLSSGSTNAVLDQDSQRSRSLRHSKPPINQLHLIGDLLLLLRAASVNVVERIQAWRQQVHQGKPRPYMYEQQNYLLSMCDDTDFLNEIQVLSSWLDFPLRRNPFIVRECLDQDDQSESRQCSSSMRSTRGKPEIPNRQKAKLIAGKHQKPSAQHPSPPPAQLVLPLASILPSGNTVDGARIEAARTILLEEESFFGRAALLRASSDSLKSSLELKAAVGGAINQYQNNFPPESSSIYDLHSFVKASASTLEKAAVRILAVQANGTRVVTHLRLHARWIHFYRQEDRTKDHSIWRCRDRYREEVLKNYDAIESKLKNALDQLAIAMEQLKQVARDQTGRLHELEVKKAQLRAARKAVGIEQQTQADKNARKKRSKPTKKPRPQLLTTNDKHTSAASSATVSIEAEVSKMLTEKRYQDKTTLVEKRVIAWQERDRLAHNYELREEMARDDLDRRRAESALMKYEDGRSHLFRCQQERRRHLREKKKLFARISATSIYKCSHEMSGKLFLISVYEQKPRGYILEGIRITAYDPVTSLAFELVISLREFDSLGYGRSRDGLAAFCKWLCLLYEKRKQRYRLIWAGIPYPPPMRSRDYDSTLICAHKEGLKLGGSLEYAIVAVYVRTSESGTLRFVVGRLNENRLVERAINMRFLFTSDEFQSPIDDRSDGGRCFVEWIHHRGKRIREHMWDKEPQHFYADQEEIHAATAHAIYTGSAIVENRNVHACVYDTNTAEYFIDAYLDDESHEPYQRIIISKCEVNPYGLQLPAASFGDLLSCLVMESREGGNESVERIATSSEYPVRRATASSKWSNKLTKYIRVLRLGRFGCRVGGSFYLATMHLVQLKTQFRAQLLIELTSLSIDPIGSVKQSIQISLSDYLRCAAVIQRLDLTDGSCAPEACAVCADRYLVLPLREHQRSDSLISNHPGDETGQAYCPGCEAAQAARICALRDCLQLLVAHIDNRVHAEEFTISIELLYRGYCDACGGALPPLLVVLNACLPSSTCEMLEYYHFRCFDYNQVVPSYISENDRERDPSIPISSGQTPTDEFRQIVLTNRVIILTDADFGYTIASANAFTNELCATLCPDASVLPFHLFFALVPAAERSPHPNRDLDIIEAVAAMRSAAHQLGEVSDAVHMGDHIGAGENGLGFDAYLVTEALLIEALRVVLEPHSEWRAPGATVGSSSWNTACEVLQNPWQLSLHLQQVDIFSHTLHTQQVLLAYFDHPSWPHSYDDVRPIFHQVLAFMMHVEHIYGFITARGGLLSNSNSSNEQQELNLTDKVGRQHECGLYAQTQVLFLW